MSATSRKTYPDIDRDIPDLSLETVADTVTNDRELAGKLCRIARQKWRHSSLVRNSFKGHDPRKACKAWMLHWLPALRGGSNPMCFNAPEWVNAPVSEHEVLTADHKLVRAREAASAFYAMGVQTRVHSMIEWCGVMSEYVKMLEFAHSAGIPPDEVDQHHENVAVDVPDFMAEYFCEKLGCQLKPFIRGNSARWRKEIDKWFADPNNLG